jgi:hypothetical protein
MERRRGENNKIRQAGAMMDLDAGRHFESFRSSEFKPKRLCVKRPSLGAILLGLIPFVAVCFSVSLLDRVYPIVLGLPFNFFWLIAWLLLTPLCMWGAYRLEVPRTRGDRHEKRGTD